MVKMSPVLLTFVTTILLSSCGSWKPVTYTPAAGAIANPGESFERLVMSSRGVRPLKVDFRPTFIALHYAVGGYAATATIAFDDVSRVAIETKRDKYYDVEITDKKGERMFRYFARDLQQAKDFVDVLTAILGTGSPKTASGDQPI